MAKISDKQFWEIVVENGGIFARIARAVEEQTGESYSRSAAFQRAKRHPERLQEAIEINLDVAESGLHRLMRQANNERVQLDAIKYFLDRKGRQRGYSTDQVIEHKATPVEKMTQEEIKAEIARLRSADSQPGESS